MSTRPVPKTAGPITWVVTAVVAAAGVAMSASQLVVLAELAGWGKYTAWLLPVLLDGSGIAGGLAYRYGRTAGACRWGLAVLIESAGLSVFGNVAAHTVVGQPPAWVMVVVAVAVPLQIVLTVHMAMLLAEGGDTTETETGSETPDVGTETASETTPVEVSAEPVEAVADSPATVLTETVEAPTETTTETPDRNTETRSETPRASTAARLGPPQGPAPATETHTAVTETRRVVPFRRPEIAATDPETDETDQTPSETEPDASGGAQGAMWQVWCRHVEDGTTDELSAAQLAREAGRGSRQLAGRYLAKWRETEVTA